MICRMRSAEVLWAAVPAALVVLAAGTGCNRGPAGPVVHMVEGVVTLDGAPLEEANVFFSPVGGEGALPATGFTGADGRFRLTSTRGGKIGRGATEGEYVVRVTKIEVPPPPPAIPMGHPDYGKALPPPRSWAEEQARIKYIVPPRYGDAKTSPLRATVSKGLNSGAAFTFDVKSK